MRPWWVVFAIACSSAPAPSPAPPVLAATSVTAAAPIVLVDAPPAAVALDAGAAPVAQPVADAGAAPAPRPLDNPVLDAKPPAVKGKVTRINVRETKTIGGVKVTFESANHTMAVGGHRSRGIWHFKLSRGRRSDEFVIDSSDDHIEAEVVAFGVFLVFQHVAYGEFDVVHVAGKAPRRLTEEQCEARIDKAANEAKLPRGNHGYSMMNDVLEHWEERWTANCLPYSGRVWFARNHDDPNADPLGL